MKKIKLFKKKLTEKNLQNVISNCKKSTFIEMKFKSKDNLTLKFRGHPYEPTYECFEVACKVTLNDGEKDVVLYDFTDKNVSPHKNIKIKIGNIENVLNILKDHKFYEI